MIPRGAHLRRLDAWLKKSRVVVLFGPRYSGKTSLARNVATQWKGPITYFDLESTKDLARLADTTLALSALKGLVILDEVHKRPDVLRVLRVLAERPRGARFLVLSSVTPEMIRARDDLSAFPLHEVPPLRLEEVGVQRARRLWDRGGFPRPFAARSATEGASWRREYVRTFLEREIPNLGIGVPAAILQRCWLSLAHHHGQPLNASGLSRALGVVDTTVRRYVELLAEMYLVRILHPWQEDLTKRQVKAPKVFVSDTGILHTLLGLETPQALEHHPVAGASWEGFWIENLISRLGARTKECYFWATHAGAELDLMVVRGRQRLGFHVKYTDAPRLTRSMKIAVEDLRLDRLDVIHDGPKTWELGPRVRAVAIADVLQSIQPLK